MKKGVQGSARWERKAMTQGKACGTLWCQHTRTHQCADGLDGGVKVNNALVDAHLVAVEGVGTLSSGA